MQKRTITIELSLDDFWTLERIFNQLSVAMNGQPSSAKKRPKKIIKEDGYFVNVETGERWPLNDHWNWCNNVAGER